MTALTRPVRRKVETLRHEPLIVSLESDGIHLREPRRRMAYVLPYGYAHTHAAKLYVQREQQRKAAERKARRAGK